MAPNKAEGADALLLGPPSSEPLLGQRPRRGKAPGADAIPVRDAAAMIAASSIGGGCLALPMVTAPMGLLPAALGLGLAWAFLMLTGLAYAEAVAHVLGAIGAAEAAASPPEISIATVTGYTLGRSASALCSALFVLQMSVSQITQVVKAATILSWVTWLPHTPCCLGLSVALGALTFGLRPRAVERVITALSVAMVSGCLALTLVCCHSAAAEHEDVAERLALADWGRLLPAAESGRAWAIPIFLSIICFGQSVPLVVQRMGVERLADARKAIVLGSLYPLLFYVAWTAVAMALLNAATAPQPLAELLTGRRAVAVPTLVMAVGAITPNIITGYLSFTQFCVDVLRSPGLDPAWRRAAALALAVALPALVACGGQELYLPLLAFCGSVKLLLYAIAPALAALASRRGHSGGPGQLPAAALALFVALAAAVLVTSMTLSLGLAGPK